MFRCEIVRAVSSLSDAVVTPVHLCDRFLDIISILSVLSSHDGISAIAVSITFAPGEPDLLKLCQFMPALTLLSSLH